MNYEYGYHIGGEMAGFLMAYLIIWLLGVGLSIVSYVFSSLGVYTIAKRRELKHPWMAWVPVLNLWTLGSISDQYQYVVQDKIRNKRKWLMGMYVAYLVVMVAAYVVMMALVAALAVDSMAGMPERQLAGTAVGLVIAVIVIWLVMMGFIVAMSVIRYVALYDLYRSCNPGNAVLFLVLSILISVTEPFFIFACRKKDGGMPPRRPQPSGYFREQYGYQPQQPTYPTQPLVYQPQPAAQPVYDKADCDSDQD